MSIPASWLPAATMTRVHLHWSAGAYDASSLDRKHYHLIVEGDGNLVRGDLPISANQAPIRGAYAAHTLNANGGAIGVSLACMAGAVESPFDAGRFPLTKDQWEAGMRIIAELCRFYRIDPTPKTVLTHAEVEKNLGILQRGKWDVARLPFDPSVVGAKAVGDRMRREVLAELDALEEDPPRTLSKPAKQDLTVMRGIVTATRLNRRRTKGGAVIDQLEQGEPVLIVDHDGDWYEIATDDKKSGFVAARYVALDA